MRISLKYKLFILLTVVSMIPMILVYYSSRYIIFRSSTEYSASIASQYVDFVTLDLNNYLRDLSQSLDVFATHADFQKFLTVPKHDYADQAKYAIGFREIIQNILRSRKEILGVLYIDRLDKVYFESFQYGLNVQYPLLDQPFISRIKETNRPAVTAAHTGQFIIGYDKNLISFVKPIIDLRTGEAIAWLMMEMNDQTLIQRFQGSHDEWNSQLILYNPDDHAVVSAKGVPASLLDPLSRLIEPETEAGPAGKNHIFNDGKERYEAAYRELAFGSWRLIWFAPLSSLSAGMRNSTSLTTIIAVASLIFAIVVAFPVMGKLLRPLYDLIKGMRNVGRGTYIPVSAKPSGSDEIQSLMRGYNMMLRDLQTMEQEVYQSKLREKERELLQLQAQINPHFLFNTLETIESYSLRNAGDAVGDMVQSVAKMMRYNVRNDGGRAPLREEIAYISHFMNIHCYRNGAELAIQMDIEEALLEVPVMKLSIQPFIENSIKYGWSPSMSEQEFSLALEVKAEDGRMCIVIRDTGNGMQPELVERIRHMLQSRGESGDPYFISHTGILNVCRRYMLAYDEQARIEIDSAPQEGTRISIDIPLPEQRG